MPSWEDFQPFIVTGLALGGVYALSGVGLVVLYRATGVLNLAFGAIGGVRRADRMGADQQRGLAAVPRLRGLHRVRRRRDARLRRRVRAAAGGP